MPVHVVNTPDPVGAVAEMVAAAAKLGGRICTTGGRAAALVYQRLADAVVDLAAVELWLSDERCVPLADERSNGGLVQRALIERLPVERRPRLRAVAVGEGAQYAAAVYERELAIASGSAQRPPLFELVVLSLGRDGHIASLFPDRPEAREAARWAVAVERPGLEPLVPRVSLTLPVLLAGKRILLLAVGEEKRAALEHALSAVAAGSGEAREPGAALLSRCLRSAPELSLVTDLAGVGQPGQGGSER